MPRFALRGRLVALAALAALAGTRPAPAEDSWDAIYIANAQVGYQHVRVEPVKDKKGRELLRVQLNLVLRFQRGRDTVDMELRYGTIETKTGEVLRLATMTHVGEGEIEASGDVVDGKMVLTLDSGAQKRQETIAWGPDVRGPYAAELSLSRDPLEPGESRSIKTFIPDLNRICSTHLEAKGPEEVILGDGKQTLQRIEHRVTDLDGKAMPELDATLWVDSGGQVLKSATQQLGGMVAYRTTEEAATTLEGPTFDLLAASIVKVPQAIPNYTTTKDVVYRVSVGGEDAMKFLPGDRRQTLRPVAGSPGAALLEVRTAGPQAGAPEPAPGPEFLRPNPLIESADPVVVEKMRKAVEGQNDPWSKAVAIQRWVAQNLASKNFSTAFAPASEVARNLSGDCTEHSVLTAAMCRAAGIPARVAIGLAYASELEGFGPHMWNEVYVNDRWVAIDAAYNESDVDATHIKLTDSSLDGVSPFEAFLPVLRVFNDKMTIQPVEIR